MPLRILRHYGDHPRRVDDHEGSPFSSQPMMSSSVLVSIFFNDTATTEIYTLSLHDALPISMSGIPRYASHSDALPLKCDDTADRKSTRLNSSHLVISYAVFCLKKKDRR